MVNNNKALIEHVCVSELFCVYLSVAITFLTLHFYIEHAYMCISCSLHLLLFLLYFVYDYIIYK